MKAKLTKQQEFNGKNYADDKEMIASWTVITWTGKGFKRPVTARCYMGRSNSASVVYATVWVHAGAVSCSGSGSASGHGYHKASAAIQYAIDSAGIELYGSPYHGCEENLTERCSIDGVGESAIEQALLAIAEAVGFNGPKIVVRG